MKSCHFCIYDNMVGTWGYYGKWNKSEREKETNTVWLQLYALFKKPKNEQSKQNRTHTHNDRQNGGQGTGGWGQVKQVKGAGVTTIQS